MKRYSRDLYKHLALLGFDRVWTNSDGYPCYVHPDDPEQTELSVSPSISDEHHMRAVLRRAQKIAGVAGRPAHPRNAAGVKERAERARERLRLAQAHRDRVLAQQAESAEAARVARLVDLRRRELEELERLMTAPPCGGNTHRGTAAGATHQTGGRRR